MAKLTLYVSDEGIGTGGVETLVDINTVINTLISHLGMDSNPHVIKGIVTSILDDERIVYDLKEEERV